MEKKKKKKNRFSQRSKNLMGLMSWVENPSDHLLSSLGWNFNL